MGADLTCQCQRQALPSSEPTGTRATKTAVGEDAAYQAVGLAFSWSSVVMWLAHVGFMFNAVLIIRKIFFFSFPSCTFI